MVKSWFSCKTETKAKIYTLVLKCMLEMNALVFGIILETLASAFKQQKEIKSIWIEKKKQKLSVFTENMVPCNKDSDSFYF